MKKKLLALIARKKQEYAALQKRSDESQDLVEVRSIGETLKKLADEIKEAEEMLAEVDGADTDDGTGQASRSDVPADAVLRNAQVVGSFTMATQPQAQEENDVRYRNAFMDYVLRGTPIPAELRADANTLTSDVGSVIPTHLVNQIIEKFDNVGMILPLITKTSYKAGVEIPTSSVKPVATWVAEGAGSDRQKKTTGKISFTYHKLRCEISMSMEVGTMALSAFETKFVENVAKAMIYAIEDAIVNGTGTGQPKGILAETGATVTGGATYAKLCEAEGKVAEEYEAGAKWCMKKKTFMGFVGMVDEQGQPIARVNYGIGGKPEYLLLGREVVPAPYVPDNKAFIFNFPDYILNTIYDMGISKKQDWETEDLLTKAVMSVDGKCADTGSLVVFDIEPTV